MHSTHYSYARLLILFLCVTSATIQARQKTFFGSIQFPSTLQTAPSLPPIFYQGIQIPITTNNESAIKRGSYELLEDNELYEFHFVITQGLTLPDSAEIQGLKTSPDHSYRLFKITRKNTMVETPSGAKENSSLKPALTWDIKELKHDKKSITLPENTFIFLMDPALISLKAETWFAEDAVIKLPTIAFATIANEKDFQELTNKMIFTSLDFAIIHKKISKTAMKRQNRVVEVQNPLNRYVVIV